MFNFAPAKSDSLISAFFCGIAFFCVCFGFSWFSQPWARIYSIVLNLYRLWFCVFMKISSFFSFVSTGAVLITEAANCKAINHVCMDNKLAQINPQKTQRALRKFRNPLYTFVFIILRPFHELVSIRGPEKLLTRRCRRNASAECKSEFMVKNTKSFFRLLELPSLAHCCAGKCFLIEAYEWGRKKMLNIIHRIYACVGFLPHNPNRLMMKCCSARHKEPASLESFVSSTWRLSKWIRAFAAWKCVHEAATEEKNFCSLFSDFDFLLAFISVWRQKGPQSTRACLFSLHAH